jgi:hypothetical protein
MGFNFVYDTPPHLLAIAEIGFCQDYTAGIGVGYLITTVYIVTFLFLWYCVISLLCASCTCITIPGHLKGIVELGCLQQDCACASVGFL